jgi:hypothetical protein
MGKGASAQLTGGDNGLTYRLLQNFIALLPATRLATAGKQRRGYRLRDEGERKLGRFDIVFAAPA